MIVCLCRGVDERGVRAAIARGAETADDVTSGCGAGADCGACRSMLDAILREARPACALAGR